MPDPLPDPLADGPWFPMPLGQGGADEGLLSLSVSYVSMFNGFTGGEATLDEIRGVSVCVDPAPPTFLQRVWTTITTTVSNWNASDWLMFASLSTLTVVGMFVNPAATLMAIGYGAASGFGLGVTASVVQQLGQGASLGSLDWAQALGSGVVGGVMGGLGGGGFATAAKIIPNFCIVATGMGVAGAGVAGYQAYDKFKEGNYWEASFNAVLAVGGAYGLSRNAFAKASQA